MACIKCDKPFTKNGTCPKCGATTGLSIPENLHIIMETQEQNSGLIVQFHPQLWAIFRKNADNHEDYGWQLLNPDNDQRSDFSWGLTSTQCTRLINRLIKNPGLGFG